MTTQISAQLVKELRERSGAGMMECKKALTETNGDLDLAFESLRKSGAAKAARKASRIAADGAIVIRASADGKKALMLEVNSETDFVAKDENFRAFAEACAATLLARAPTDIDALMGLPLEGGGGTVEEARLALVAKVGENIQIRRFITMETSGVLGTYQHGSRIGVLVAMEGGAATGEGVALARDLAMHIAASRPVCVDSSGVPAELLAKEKEIFTAQAQESGKPANIIEKMVAGRLEKYLKEVTLLGQPFVKDPDTTVEKLLAQHKAKVAGFQRYEVGEGIEKKTENFAEEVMSQVRGG